MTNPLSKAKGCLVNYDRELPSVELFFETREDADSAHDYLIRGGSVEPTGDRYVGEPEHIPAPISGGQSVITGYDPSTRRAVIATPKASPIPTWRERCQTQHTDGQIVTSRMIEQRMQEEIDDLRSALNRNGDV